MEDRQEVPCSSYYSILGVDAESSIEEIKRAYHRLAMQWHPDKWTGTPSLLSEAKCKFQQIQEAYSVLSDHKKRKMYDIGLYDPQEEEEEAEGLSDFVQEMWSLMAQERRKNKKYSMEELQTMLTEMVQDFEPSRSKRARSDSNAMVDNGGSCFGVPSWGVCGTSSYCSN
ncbi:chaperone protein DnaJ [Ricinus communis]|uniref:chaperone protein DnaJ n=1 Tax=Ricinus communis TaxID=3988 RepID=UPI00077237C3|nr:chaperone protein DnaJ [Ricinus communis]|eukprot:XP_015578969.1 uncharacterized protein LOC8258183 [Ricinus communis]